VHGGGHDHATEHRAASRRALWTSLCVLTVFFGVELAGGLWTGSLALISDAGHLLTDVGAIALALLAQWVATRPSSPRRSYGYKRAEILAALFNGMTLWLVAALILIEAVRRFDAPPEVESLTMVAIATIGLLAQIVVTMLLRRARSESLNVEGAYLHALTDALQSVGVIAAGLVMATTGWFWLDPAISVLIALLIFYGGGRLVFEASHVLLEGTPREVDLEAVLHTMHAHEGVERVSDLHAWSLTTGDNSLSAHVVAEQQLEAVDREQLRCLLDQMLRERFPLHHITLQVESTCELGERCGCREWLTEPDAGGNDTGA